MESLASQLGSCGCGRSSHFTRRTLLKAAGVGGMAWLTPVAQQLARAAEKAPKGKPAQSVIVIWLAGGASQLETFDPHPGTKIGGDTKAIETALAGVQIGSSLEQTAAEMNSIALVRSVVSEEGDHERATYNMKTGYRPDPTLVHPSIGAAVCHELPTGTTEIPRHISILPNAWPGRGGYLGAKFDAFKAYDPRQSMPDTRRRVPKRRYDARMEDLKKINALFARGRLEHLEDRKTNHQTTINQALKMMDSDQLTAFDVMDEPDSVRLAYGDSPFGRACLAAVRLVGVGVRCVEVTLDGWDSHTNNHKTQTDLAGQLDAAYASLLRDLRSRGLLEQTIVLCGGEFGRTPHINPAGGRDHWPHGFSVALAGGGIQGGQVIGETDPAGSKKGPKDTDAVKIGDIHATILRALNIDFTKKMNAPFGRSMTLSDGHVIERLLR